MVGIRVVHVGHLHVFLRGLAGPDQVAVVGEERHDHATVLVTLAYAEIQEVYAENC